MIFYFSGTGNSLYVAEQLDSDIRSIPQVMYENRLVFKSDIIGIVCPSYGGEAPQMVQDFLKKAHFDCQYFFIVMTYGASIEIASDNMKKVTEEAGIHAVYFNAVRMADNYLPGFDVNEEAKKDKHAEEQISLILNDIRNRKKFWPTPFEEDTDTFAGYQNFIREHPEQSWKNITFTVNDSCVKCGICTRVCPGGCIHVVNDSVIHDHPESCQHCFACVHNCPQKAIGLSVAEINRKARYRNNHISLMDLIKANHQF